jgi:Xaa-Pro aminopeptidase
MHASSSNAMHRIAAAILLVAVALVRPAAAQHHQTDFPPEEFKERWQTLYARIGSDAVAVVQGMPLTDGYTLPRQYNTFYYLSGIETPGAYLLFDGRTRTATLYLPKRNEALERAEGRVLSAEDAELVKRLTGVDEVRAVEAMTDPDWPVGRSAPGVRARPPIYAEFSPAEGAGQSRGELVAAET